MLGKRQAAPAAGFTLIELLVVIAIIAILAAILFPVFARARAKAQQNNCLSNCKQIMLAYNMYTTDFDEHWPYDFGDEGFARYATTIMPSLSMQLTPYIKTLQIFQCPGQLPYNAAWGASYIPNRWTTGPTPPAPAAATPTVALTGTDTLMFACAMNSGWNIFQVGQNDPTTGLEVGSPFPATVQAWTGSTYCAHQGGWNVAFADSHCKWISPPALKYDMWTANPDD